MSSKTDHVSGMDISKFKPTNLRKKKSIRKTYFTCVNLNLFGANSQISIREIEQYNQIPLKDTENFPQIILKDTKNYNQLLRTKKEIIECEAQSLT